MPRKKLAIDEQEVVALARDGASNREIAAILGCDDKTVANRFSAILTKTRAERRVGLKRAQYQQALDGNATMLVWLGKNELGQTDKGSEPPPADEPPRDQQDGQSIPV